jgi:hypothetical protein
MGSAHAELLPAPVLLEGDRAAPAGALLNTVGFGLGIAADATDPAAIVPGETYG